MTTKTYTARGNCARAAKKALGKNAKAGVDFTIVTHQSTTDGGKPTYSFEAKAKAKTAKAPKGERKPRVKKRLIDQPKCQKALKLMRRESGVTVAQGASLLEVEPHTFRGMVSRMRKDDKSITVGREFKKVVYRAAEAKE